MHLIVILIIPKCYEISVIWSIDLIQVDGNLLSQMPCVIKIKPNQEIAQLLKSGQEIASPLQTANFKVVSAQQDIKHT